MKTEKRYKISNFIFLVILLVYPLRHITQGLDLQDTGYNFANFLYMGTDHMDPMWLFSTYLATALGHFFTLLPFGKTVMGLNFYTGLTVSGLAMAGFLFCTKKWNMPSPLVFLGEFLAVNLCWCPTAVLYNYLTYILFFSGAVLVYLGLTEEKKKYLILAGCCLGSNILVRFSNVPEAGLILAVWAYAFWTKRKDGKALGVLQKAAKDTGLCLAGYLGSLAIWALWIQIRYGLGNYVTGIQRLFAMTETATDYKSSSMLMGLILPFKQMIYHMARAAFFMVVALVLVAITEGIRRILRKKQGKQEGRLGQTAERFFAFAEIAECVAAAVAMIAWLYKAEFVSFAYFSYDSMYRPAIVLLMMACFTAAVVVVLPKFSVKEKLMSAIVVLVLFLTSLGSNNNVYPSINNLFLIAPFTLYYFYLFLKMVLGKKPPKAEEKTGIIPVLGMAPAICGLALLGMLFVHSEVFGLGFVFAESTGVREFQGSVTGNVALRGIHLKAERAAWLQEASDYINKEQLQGRDTISYGDIPTLSFVFRMPAAFNPWPDLDSYNVKQMEKDMEEVKNQIKNKQIDKPVLFLEHTYQLLYTNKRDVLENEGMNPDWLDVLEKDPKWILLQGFMDEYDYQMDHENKKMSVWR